MQTINRITLKNLLYAITNLEHYVKVYNGRSMADEINEYITVVVEGLIANKFVDCEIINYELIDNQKFIALLLIKDDIRVSVRQKLNEKKWLFYQRHLKLYCDYGSIVYGRHQDDGIPIYIDNIRRDYGLLKDYAIAFSLVELAKSYKGDSPRQYCKSILNRYGKFGIRWNYIERCFKRLCTAEENGNTVKATLADSIKNGYTIKIK